MLLASLSPDSQNRDPGVPPNKRESGSEPIGTTLDRNLPDLSVEVVFLDNAVKMWKKRLKLLKRRSPGARGI
jgi:hypothetical protein